MGKYGAYALLFDVLKRLKESGKGERMPFLDDRKRPVYMLHKSAVDNTIVTRALEGDGINELTFNDLFEKAPDLEKLGKESFGIVSENVSLADVKNEMRQITNCQDTLITRNGLKNDSVTGLITNVILEKYSKV